MNPWDIRGDGSRGIFCHNGPTSRDIPKKHDLITNVPRIIEVSIHTKELSSLTLSKEAVITVSVPLGPAAGQGNGRASGPYKQQS